LAAGGPEQKKCKIISKGVVMGLRDLLHKILGPLHFLETADARNFKFGGQIGNWGALNKK